MTTKTSPSRPARRGRPSLTEEDVARQRRRIITAARKLFLRNGIQGVSMRAVAAEAGCSPRLLYQSFAHKEAILRYVWEDFFVELFEQCEAAQACYGTPIEQLRAFLKAYADYWIAHPDRFELVFLVKDQIGGPDDRYYLDQFGVVGRFDALRRVVENCRDEATGTPPSADVITQIIVSGLNGLLHGKIAISEYPWSPFEVLFEAWLDMTLSGAGLLSNE